MFRRRQGGPKGRFSGHRHGLAADRPRQDAAFRAAARRARPGRTFAFGRRRGAGAGDERAAAAGRDAVAARNAGATARYARAPRQPGAPPRGGRRPDPGRRAAPLLRAGSLRAAVETVQRRVFARRGAGWAAAQKFSAKPASATGLGRIGRGEVPRVRASRRGRCGSARPWPIRRSSRASSHRCRRANALFYWFLSTTRPCSPTISRTSRRWISRRGRPMLCAI